LIGIIKLNQAKAKQKKLNLCFEYDPAIPTYLVGDPKRIQKIVLELVTNALNFTEEGSVNVSVKLAKKEGRGLVLKIIVADTGIGIAPDKQQEIYARFKRLTPSCEGIYKGAGLGLSLIKQFVDELDGEIYVESEPKKGTTFICLIPLKEALLDDAFGTTREKPYHSLPLTTDASATLTKPDTKDLSQILLVEDSLIAVKIATLHLASLGCVIDHAPDGETGIRMAAQKHYDLILMDIGLPDIDGLDVTNHIRLNELNTEKPVPIIALTAHIDIENKQQLLQAGINAVLSKPLTENVLRDVLNTFIPDCQSNTL
jgi:two-component system aerobic respiration control sensor histidine kinase ArcB